MKKPPGKADKYIVLIVLCIADLRLQAHGKLAEALGYSGSSFSKRYSAGENHFSAGELHVISEVLSFPVEGIYSIASTVSEQKIASIEFRDLQLRFIKFQSQWASFGIEENEQIRLLIKLKENYYSIFEN
jgi:hypothetical protein